jgi:hypothetical protein
LLILIAGGGGWYYFFTVRPAPLSVKPTQAAHFSVAVLPFTNLSGDPSQDYFADGVTENLTTELSRIKDSFVIARNTAFTYKGKSIDAKAGQPRGSGGESHHGSFSDSSPARGRRGHGPLAGARRRL